MYDSPTNGSFKKRKRATEVDDDKVTTLEHVEEFLAGVPLHEDVILLGDFNARTGTLDDILPSD